MAESLSALAHVPRRAPAPVPRVSWTSWVSRLKSSATESNAAVGGVRTLLRLEGAVVLAASLAAYAQFGAGWGVFALWLLVPDLAFLGYLAGPRVGAALYNAAHSYLGAVALLVVPGHHRRGHRPAHARASC
jgi:type IV secretory pathway TrbD component